MRGGVTSPDELRRIADVAEKYNVRMVKVTGSQRIDLLGIKKADLPRVWADLGMPSGQAYTKGVRMVKTCVGTEFCRFGVQDSTRAGIELERRLENLFTPHKVKMGAVGCPRNCAEATVKDIGMVGQEGSWQVVVGGAAGKSVRKADLLITVETTARRWKPASCSSSTTARTPTIWSEPTISSSAWASKRFAKRPYTRRRPTSSSCWSGCRRSKAMAKDAWLERDAPVHPTQFVQIQPHGDTVPHEFRIELDADHDNRKIPPLRRTIGHIGGVELAIFNLRDRFVTIENHCPHKGGPLCDGIVSGTAVVCPLHGWRFDLDSGMAVRASLPACVTTFPTRVEDGIILVDVGRGSRIEPRSRPVAQMSISASTLRQSSPAKRMRTGIPNVLRCLPVRASFHQSTGELTLMNIRNKATSIRLADFTSAPMRAFHMAWIAFFLCFFSWFGVAPLMPVIREELHLTKAQTGNSIIASVALAVFGRLLMGWLCDRIGPRKTHTWLLILGSLPVMCDRLRARLRHPS